VVAVNVPHLVRSVAARPPIGRTIARGRHAPWDYGS